MYLVLQVSTCLVLHTLQYKFCNFECFFKFSLNWGLTSFLYTLNGKFQLVQSLLCSTWWELTRFSDKTWKWQWNESLQSILCSTWWELTQFSDKTWKLQWNESLQSILCSTWWELTRFSDKTWKGWQSWLKIGIEPRGLAVKKHCESIRSSLLIIALEVCLGSLGVHLEFDVVS